MADAIQPGRLAFRHEGRMWNAYFAAPDSMTGAVLIGSILVRSVSDSPELKAAFIELMKIAVGAALESMTGVTPDWNEPTISPEHERAGHA